MFGLLAMLWFAQPAPLDMPVAEAYHVKDSHGTQWLEDRYDELDLWTADTVLSRWQGEDGRYLTVSKLESLPPMFLGQTVTREQYRADRVPIPVKDRKLRERAIEKLSPFDLPERPASPEQEIRGFDQVAYYEGTNRSAIVCACLPEKADAWYLTVWTLLPDDDLDEAREIFEEEFLAKWPERLKEGVRSACGRTEPRRTRERAEKANRSEERELYREDAIHSVTNYPNWHVTAAPEFLILDDLPPGNTAIAAVTNELTVMRAKYAAALPSPINGSNVLAVARIFKNEDEFRASLAENEDETYAWSAGFWNPRKREIVAYLPPTDLQHKQLLKLFRHEALHQYFSYACSMIPPSSWINEGYAQYFEDESVTDWGIAVDLDAVATLLPLFMVTDGQAFYDGTPEEVRLKYRIAWSLAYFLEKGAPKVRFQPFKDVTKNYIQALLRHQDCKRATLEAFGTEDNFKLFIAEWKKFWMAM